MVYVNRRNQQVQLFWDGGSIAGEAARGSWIEL
jgi:hypothetical protein